MTGTDPLRDDDLLATVRRADPAGRLGLARSDDEAFAAIREGILLTARQEAGEPASTLPGKGRRAVLAGALTLGLIAAGTTAYAAYDRWYVGGTPHGLTCMDTYVDPFSHDLHDVTGGLPFTSDPVADCQEYQRLSGRTPIRNPIAITVNDMTIVAPADGVPSDAVAARPATAREEAIARLRNSLDDYVDGGRSRCFTIEDGLVWARAEADRLGLTDLPVEEQQLGPDTPKDGPCGWFLVLDERILFSPERQNDPTFSEPTDSVVYRLRDGLRDRIAGQCLPLGRAEAVTTGLIGQQPHWPTSATADESLPCTTVDLVAGGSMQVFLRGPSAARN